MLKIDVLAVGPTGPITTKAALKQLIKESPAFVRVLPVNPSPALSASTLVPMLPFGTPVTAHTGKSTAEIERKSDGKIVVR